MNIQIERLRQPRNIANLTFDGRLDAHSREKAKIQLHGGMFQPSLLT